MIKYKVITKDRKSCGNLFDRLGKYCLDYPVGEEVVADPTTIGIAVFDTKRQAINFIAGFHFNRDLLMVIKVKPTSRGKRPQAILDLTSSNISSVSAPSLFSSLSKLDYINNTYWPVPSGTICYPIEITKGDLFTYLMRWNDHLFVCNCPGAVYHRRCWHSEMVELLMNQKDIKEPWAKWAEEGGEMSYGKR